MGDIATENYKKSLTRVVERWKAKVEGPAKKIVEIDQAIDKLEAKKPPSDDDKAKLEELKKAYVAQRKLIDKANLELRTDMLFVEPPQKTPSNEKELIKLPDFIKEIIKAKGVPLGKNVSIKPDIKFDLKAMKLKEASLTITWRF